MRRCVAMVYETCSEGSDLDPMVQQLVRKVMLLKRIMSKYPKVEIKVKSAICAYTIEGKKGTLKPAAASALDAIPHCGPIGHLLTQLDKVGATIDDNYTIHQNLEVDISITATPWQEIKPQIEALGQRARLRQARDQRALLENITEIDAPTLRATIAKRSKDQKQLLQHILTGATWTAQQIYQIGRADNNKCRLCGQPELNI